MAAPRYKHVVEFNERSNKIVIHRLIDGGGSHLYTEIELAKIPESERTLEVIGRILGEALILDTNVLRDRLA